MRQFQRRWVEHGQLGAVFYIEIDHPCRVDLREFRLAADSHGAEDLGCLVSTTVASLLRPLKVTTRRLPGT